MCSSTLLHMNAFIKAIVLHLIISTAYSKGLKMKWAALIQYHYMLEIAAILHSTCTAHISEVAH